MSPKLAATLLASLLERCERADDGLVLASSEERRALEQAIAHLGRLASEAPEPEPEPLDLEQLSAAAVVAIDATGAEPRTCVRDGARVRLLEAGEGLPAMQSPEDPFAERLRRACLALPDGLRDLPRVFVLPEGLDVKEEGRLRQLVMEIGGEGARALPHALAVAAQAFGGRPFEGRLSTLVVHADARGLRATPVMLRGHVDGARLVAYRVRSDVDDIGRLLERLEALAPPPYPLLASGWLIEQDSLRSEARLAEPPPPEADGLGPRVRARWAAALGAGRVDQVEDRGWVRLPAEP